MRSVFDNNGCRDWGSEKMCQHNYLTIEPIKTLRQANWPVVTFRQVDLTAVNRAIVAGLEKLAELPNQKDFAAIIASALNASNATGTTARELSPKAIEHFAGNLAVKFLKRASTMWKKTSVIFRAKTELVALTELVSRSEILEFSPVISTADNNGTSSSSLGPIVRLSILFPEFANYELFSSPIFNLDLLKPVGEELGSEKLEVLEDENV